MTTENKSLNITQFMNEHRNANDPMHSLSSYIQRTMFDCVNEGKSDLDVKMKIQDAIDDLLRGVEL